MFSESGSFTSSSQWKNERIVNWKWESSYGGDHPEPAEEGLIDWTAVHAQCVSNVYFHHGRFD